MTATFLLSLANPALGSDSSGADDLNLAAEAFPNGLPTPIEAPLSCTGDCDRDGVVSVDELVGNVALVLGESKTRSCPALDCRHSLCKGGGVIGFTPTIDCLITAVRDALEGCRPKACETKQDCDDQNDCTSDTCLPTGCLNFCRCR